MLKKNSEYFSVGSFAKLCGVSRQTLIFYDRSGIFSPDCVDGNGYRYYSYKQYDTLGVILALKKIGMPLGKIAQFMSERNGDSLARLLSAARENVREQLCELSATEQIIARQLEQIEAARDIRPGEAAVRRQPEERFILSEEIEGEHETNYIMALSSLIDYCREKGYSHGFSIGAIMEEKRLRRGDFHGISHFYIKLLRKTGDAREWHKPEGAYAEIYHKGDYSEMEVSYRALLEYIAREDLRTLGPFYEYDLINGLSAQSPGDYLTLISVRIEE